VESPCRKSPRPPAGAGDQRIVRHQRLTELRPRVRDRIGVAIFIHPFKYNAHAATTSAARLVSGHRQSSD
jgi:hypothetical protein